MSKANSELEWARAPPPSGPVWRTLTNAIYNPKEKSFLGRTPKRWGIVLTFYMVFYAVLALMFAACMGGLFMTLDPKMPTYTLGKSIIGENPGVAARPLPNLGFTVNYDVNNSTGISLIVTELDKFMQHYHKRYPSEECSVKDNFGYPDTPCFFIKLNKIIDWLPQCYNDASNLPAEMSDELKGYIKTVDASQMNQIWVSCWEEKSNQTTIEYPWGQGLPALYYPYTNQENYWSPLVAVRLTPPVNELVVVRCRVWAKNVMYNKSMKDPSGYTRLQLYVKDVGNSTEV